MTFIGIKYYVGQFVWFMSFMDKPKYGEVKDITVRVNQEGNNSIVYSIAGDFGLTQVDESEIFPSSDACISFITTAHDALVATIKGKAYSKIEDTIPPVPSPPPNRVIKEGHKPPIPPQ